MTKLDFIATAEQTGERIDRFLSAQDTGLTRSAVQKLIEDGGVTVGGKKVSKNYKLRNGDSVEIIIPDPVELDVKPQDIPVEIVYEDSELLVCVNFTDEELSLPEACKWHDGELLIHNYDGELGSELRPYEAFMVYRAVK